MTPRWLLIAAVALVAGGCGQKGPLYLPDKNAKVVTTPAAAAPAPGTTQPAAPPKPKANDPDQDSQPQPPQPPQSPSTPH